MVTGVGLRQILLPQLNWVTSKTPYLVQESRTYLLYKPSYSLFSVKISKFVLPGNGGWSETNFTNTVKLLDTENPILGAGMGVVSPIQAELLSIFCRNFQIFVAMATGFGLAQI